MRYLISILVTLCILASVVVYGKAPVVKDGVESKRKADAVFRPRTNLSEIDPTHILIEIEFPDIKIQSDGSLPRIPGAVYIPVERGLELPVSMFILQIPPSKYTVRIISSELKTMDCHFGGVDGSVSAGYGESTTQKNPPFNSPLITKGGQMGMDSRLGGKDGNVSADYSKSAIRMGREIAKLEKMGSFHGRQLARLTVCPILYDPAAGEAKALKRVKIRIDFAPYKSEPGMVLAGGALKTLKGLLHDFPETMMYPGAPGNYPAAPVNAAGSGGIKIAVSEEGLYRISYDNLADAGLLAEMAGNPGNLHLYCRGEEVPIYVFGVSDGVFNQGDYIDFWGIPNRETYLSQSPDMYKDPWSDENIYWLKAESIPGMHIFEESGVPAMTDPAHYYQPLSYRASFHFEEDNNFERLSQVPIDSIRDHWYYDNGVDANESRNYSFYLPYPAEGVGSNPAQLRCALMGLTYPIVNGGTGAHLAYLAVNDYSSAEMAAGSQTGGEWPWIGQNIWMVQTEGGNGIPADRLNHGNNILRVSSSGGTPAGNINTVLLNWYELEYSREYKADGGFIHFTVSAEGPIDTLYDFNIGNFDSPDVVIYKLGFSRIEGYEVDFDAVSGKYSVHFQDWISGGEEYAVSVRENIKTPAWMEQDTVSDLKIPVNQAEYLVIAYHDFMNNPALSELLERRSENGAKLVDIEDIYDEFNYGIKSPAAIKEFLKYAYYNWGQPKPYYVLLAGDGSFDQKDYFGSGGNLIPSYYLQTQAYGYTASDYWMTLLDGDDFIPEITIGRIPARSEGELEAYLEKVEANETNPAPGYWHNKYLFVAGRNEASLDFEQRAQAAIDLLPESFMVERLGTTDINSPYFGGNTELTGFINSGVSIVSYNGHGGGAVWEDNNLLNLAGIQSLNNAGKYPFVANFTCYICQYDVQDQGATMGEEFLFAPEKGAIGVYGSTGLGWFNGGSVLQEAMSLALGSEERLSLGELISLSKVLFMSMQFGGGQYELSGEAYATMMNMVLLGDPGAVLMTPGYSDKIEISAVIQGGEEITLTSAVPFAEGEYTARVYDDNSFPMFAGGAIWQSSGIEFNNNSLTLTVDSNIIPIPAKGSFRIAYYTENGSETGALYADFYNGDSLSAAWFDSLEIMPEPVTDGDSLTVKCKIVNTEGMKWAKTAYMVMESLISGVILAQDTVEMNRTGDYDWESEQIPPLEEFAGNVLKYHVFAEDSAGTPGNSTVNTTYIVDHRPDLAVDSTSIGLGGATEVKLRAGIENNSDIAVDSVQVKFTVEKEGQSDYTAGSMWIEDISGGEEIIVEITPNPPFEDGIYRITVQIDAEGLVEDSDLSNNSAVRDIIIDRFAVSQAAGTNRGGVHESFRYGSFELEIGANSVSGNKVLECENIDVGQMNQAGLQLFDSSAAVNLSFAEGSVDLTNAAGLNIGYYFSAGDSSVIDSLAIHYRSGSTEQWSKLTTIFQTLGGGEYRAQSTSGVLGDYALMMNSDNIPPEVEISIDGQAYTEGCYVTSRPRISAVFSDGGGMDGGAYMAIIDGDTLAAAQLSMPVSNVNGGVSSVTINELLGSGTHEISFIGRDMSGNLTRKDIQVQNAGVFEFRFVSNYPNPFSEKTLIAYSLTDMPEGDITVKIYTAAGRSIRTIRQSAVINYGEIEWDGRDDKGREIANGVYFCKLKVHNWGKNLEKIIKMAKMRG